MSAARGVTALVVGGGVAGATTALCLARRGLSALVVESSVYDGFRVGDTLPPIGRVLLTRLGLWERFVAQGHVPSQAIRSAWGSPELAEQHSLFSPFGTGWHLDRSRFDAMVSTAAEEHGATVLRGARVTSLDGAGPGPVRARITGPQGELEAEAQVVVDATGRAAAIARALGSERLAYDRLVGILGLFTVPPGGPPLGPSLLLESVPQGWLYSVPLPDGSLLVAAMVDADAIAPSGLRPLGYWTELLAQSQHTRARTEGLTPPASLVVRKASTERLSQIASIASGAPGASGTSGLGPAFIAVGDAASSYDPLSSQGICKALMTAELAAQAIAEWLQGDASALSAYAERIGAELSRFLSDRAQYYAVERRWPDSLFWRRRLPPEPRDSVVSLDPRARITVGARALDPQLVAQLEGALPLGEVERLYALCQTPAPAHELLARFQQTARLRLPPRDALTALQGLLRGGALTLADPPSRARSTDTDLDLHLNRSATP
ncbi:MAG: NAD(P)/FAD-dependent oxidoreductase [Polyangia bacterium]